MSRVIDQLAKNSNDSFMDVHTYRVTCSNCNATRTVKLAKAPLGTQIDWLADDGSHQIVSFRERLDGQFGWQCACGNNDLMTTQEKQNIENPAVPKPEEIADIVKHLVVQPPKFSLEQI